MKPVEKKKENKVYCTECGRKIIRWRENSYKDFSARKMHKTCWKKKRDNLLLFSNLY